MKIKFIGDHQREVIPATGARPFVVDPGDVVDVDEATAGSLLDQPVWFERVPEPKTQKKENS